VSVSRVLIVDDDDQLHECLEEMSPSWGMAPESLTNPLLIGDVIRKTFYHLILLNIAVDEGPGLALLEQIAQWSPETKIIVMTSQVDRDKTVKALRLGAFDFFEKPLNSDLLVHVIQGAVNTQKLEMEHQQTQAELREKTTQLEEVNRILRDTNTALDVLIHKVEHTEQETKEQIISTIRILMLPLIEQLRQDKRLGMCEPQLAQLAGCIEDLTGELAASLYITSVLSLGELRVASLVRLGMRSDEIAQHLHIAPDTVKTHRRNIRRKLRLIGTNKDLRIYLQSLDRHAVAAEHSARVNPNQLSPSLKWSHRQQERHPTRATHERLGAKRVETSRFP